MIDDEGNPYPNISLLHFIREGKPIALNDLVDLWYRVQNDIVIETIVDIAVERHMPLWAAEQAWRQEWEAYKQNTPTAEQ